LKGKEFDVQMSDGHRSKPGRQMNSSAKPEYQLVIKGAGTCADKVSKSWSYLSVPPFSV
jgi:hypothetical protein